MLLGRHETQRRIFRFFARPHLILGIELLGFAPLILWGDSPGMGSFYVLLSPWWASALLVLNLPLAAACFRQFHLDPPTRRNHALEHATILRLRASGIDRTAGRADATGFRVAGVPEGQIRRAFAEVRSRMASGEAIEHISPRCGSNRIAALGFSVLLLVLAASATLLFKPPMLVRWAFLGGVVMAFSSFRHSTGNWIQRRYFMRTDFADASIRRIRKVRARAIEPPPVFHVETLVQVPRRDDEKGVLRPPATDLPRPT